MWVTNLKNTFMDNRKKIQSKFRKEKELPESLKWDEVKDGILEKMDAEINAANNEKKIKSFKWSLLILLVFLTTCMYINKATNSFDFNSEVVFTDANIQPDELAKANEFKSHQSKSDTEISKKKLESNQMSKLNNDLNSNDITSTINNSDVTDITQSDARYHKEDNARNAIKEHHENGVVLKQRIYESRLNDTEDSFDNHINNQDKINSRNTITTENYQKSNDDLHVESGNQIVRIGKLPIQKCCALLLNDKTPLIKEPKRFFQIVKLPDNSIVSRHKIKIQQGLGSWKNSVFYFNQDNTELMYSKQINANTYVGITRSIADKWNIETGLKYNRLSSNISFYEEKDTIIQLSYVSKKRINSLTGELIDELSSTRSVTALKWTRIKYSNSLHIVSVPLLINREIPVATKLNATIGLGLEYGLVLGGSGKWLSNNSDIDDQQNMILVMNSQQMKRHVFSTTSSIGLQYLIKNNIDLNLNMQYSNSISNISANDRLNLKPKSVFASIGISYHL